MKKKLTLLFSFCVLAILAIAQPANDDCSNAIPITLAANEAAAVATSGTTVNATASTTPTSICSGSWFGDDVWYTVSTGATVPSNGITLRVLTNQTGAMSPLGMAVYTDCNATTAPISCFSACNGADSLSLPFVQANQTYYIRLWSGCSPTANSGLFSLYAFESYGSIVNIQDNVLWGDVSGQGDFSTGLNGWTSNAITTGDNWVWEADASANGAFRTTTIVSPTAYNGAALFDADFMTTSVNPNPTSPYPQHTGELISPIIDCTNFPDMSCKFYQSYDALNGDTYFSYSTNGGTTWSTPISINDDIAGNDVTPSPSVKRIFMPGAAGNSQVQVKFTADMDFYNWIIDDVQLVEKAAYDLHITDFYAIAPNYAMPKSQVDSVRFLADVGNIGSANQSNVTLSVLVVRNSDGSPVFSASQNLGTINANDTLENTLLSAVFLPSSTIESYTATYTVSGDTTDFNPIDNSVSFTFEVVADEFAKEPALTRNITPADDNAWTYGVQYFVKNGTQLTNCSDTINRTVSTVSFGVSNPTELIGESVAIFIEKPLSGNIFDANNSGAIESAERQIVAFGTYTFTGNEIANQLIPVQVLSFSTGGVFHLEDNTSYAVVVNFVPSNSTVTLRLSANSNLDYSASDFAAALSGVEQYSELLDVGNSGDYSTAGFVGNPVPAIRMQIDETYSFTNSTVTTLNESICQGGSYTVGTQTFNQTGSHTVTLTGANNCDSIVNLNLTVLIPINKNLVKTVCNNGSYTVGSQTFSQSGNYSVTFTAANGCDSIVNLDLTVLPVLATTLNQTICQGFSYTVGTSSFNQAGTYNVLVTSYNGCDSTVTLNLTVINNQSSTSTINPEICQGQSFDFLNEVYFTAGTYVDTTTTVNGCDSIITINLTVHPLDSTTINATICAGDTYDFNGTTYSSSGVYQLVLNNAENCDSTVILDLVVNTPLTLADTVILPIIGATNGAIDITISGGMMPYQFLWSNGATTEDINNIPLDVYSVTVTDAAGCSEIFTFDLSVNTNSIIQSKLDINYYPNPITNNQLLNIAINSEKSMNLDYTVSNILGQNLNTGNIQINTGANNQTIKMPETSGSYFVRFYNESDLVKVLHVIVE